MTGSACPGQIRGELTQAIAAPGRIREPFRDSVTDPAAADEIEAARTAVRTVRTTFGSRVLPFVTR
ncbi:hypothetical protein ACLESO_27225 [Pyxidicoccus sp. 3LG]